MDDKRLVTRADMAQYLLTMGYTIVSIARNKYNREQTVFYFKNERDIDNVIQRFKNNLLDKKI